MTQKNQTRGSCDILYQLLNTDSSSQDIKLRFFVQSIIIVARYIYYLMIRPGIVSVLFCSVMSSFGTDWQLELGGALCLQLATSILTRRRRWWGYRVVWRISLAIWALFHVHLHVLIVHRRPTTGAGGAEGGGGTLSWHRPWRRIWLEPQLF